MLLIHVALINALYIHARIIIHARMLALSFMRECCSMRFRINENLIHGHAHYMSNMNESFMHVHE